MSWVHLRVALLHCAGTSKKCLRRLAVGYHAPTNTLPEVLRRHGCTGGGVSLTYPKYISPVASDQQRQQVILTTQNQCVPASTNRQPANGPCTPPYGNPPPPSPAHPVQCRLPHRHNTTCISIGDALYACTTSRFPMFTIAAESRDPGAESRGVAAGRCSRKAG